MLRRRKPRTRVNPIDREKKDYKRIEINEQVEVFSLIVGPTLEVIVVESPGYLRRKFDEETGLTLIDLGGGPT